ncbi:hypothetical protein [uncultured Aureimonas sp.]|uniref:hypothetical protein n=1 Tax=uncultured Aureimonas sp. TaxID=1604662 RepID=UPI002601576B|nr:hypothetical protein [uncultured Aureimonas sp.]
MTDEAQRRRGEHRRIWLELTFDVPPDDVDAAVTRLWAAGETSTAVACRILDTDAAGLHGIAQRHDIPITRTDGAAR